MYESVRGTDGSAMDGMWRGGAGASSESGAVAVSCERFMVSKKRRESTSSGKQARLDGGG